MYIVEYEQNGHDKATYGKQVVESLAQQFKIRRIKLGKSQLYICRDFYSTYPHFWQFILEGMAQANAQPLQQRLSALQTNSSIFQTLSGKSDTDRSEPSKLLNQLTFSHFTELVKYPEPLKRLFYETETLVNSWSVRELRRAMDSLLFERTGSSRNPETVLKPHRQGSGLLQPSEVIGCITNLATNFTN